MQEQAQYVSAQQRWTSNNDLKRPREEEDTNAAAGNQNQVQQNYWHQENSDPELGRQKTEQHVSAPANQYTKNAAWQGEDEKPAKRQTFETESDGVITVGKVSSNRKVRVRTFSGKVLVDIREFYTGIDKNDKKEKDLPGKKGISLTVEQWKELKKIIGDVDAAIASFD